MRFTHPHTHKEVRVTRLCRPGSFFFFLQFSPRQSQNFRRDNHRAAAQRSMFSKWTRDKHHRDESREAQLETQISRSHFTHFQSQMCRLPPSIRASIELKQLLIGRRDENVETRTHKEGSKQWRQANLEMK